MEERAIEQHKKEASKMCERCTMIIISCASVSAHLTSPLKHTGMYEEKKHQTRTMIIK